MNRNIIAILRGITPDEASIVANTLFETGINKIEVPLNSPNPFESIIAIKESLGRKAQIGAGTVLKIEQVQRLSEIGADMVVSPNMNIDVIKATKAAGMKSYPGIFTPTEAFTALDAGADALKLFPAELAGPSGLKALRAVLPIETEVLAVGGAGAHNFKEWYAAGANGFGIGSALYKPKREIKDVAFEAQKIITAYDAVFLD